MHSQDEIFDTADFEEDEPTLSEEAGVRYLHFNSPWVQGAMQVRHPYRLALNYTQVMMAWLLFTQLEPEDHIKQLGLGAGSITRFCYKHFDNPLVVVERNPMVMQICYQYFRLPIHDRLTIKIDDANRWVRDPRHHNSARVLMVDLYDAQAQGPVCDSLAFYEGCRSVLAPGGILSVNLFGEHASYEHNIGHLLEAFDDQILLLPITPEGNRVVLAFRDGIPPIDMEALLQRARALEADYRWPVTRWVRGLSRMVPNKA